ncbi:MAG: hypothetical protein GY765_39915 [bacterium]|nr:hypothetical protein [bacterium]
MSDGIGLIFSEVQQFRQPLLWIVFCAICTTTILVGGLVLRKYSRSQKRNKIVALSCIMPVILILFLGIFLFITKLEVEVRRTGIGVRFFPLQLSFNEIPLDNIAEYRLLSFSPISDYGGWGIRYGGKGKAYIVSGSRGVLFKFKDGGKDLCIGSGKPEELIAAIDTLKGKTNTE